MPFLVEGNLQHHLLRDFPKPAYLIPQALRRQLVRLPRSTDSMGTNLLSRALFLMPYITVICPTL